MTEDEAKERWCPMVRLMCDGPREQTLIGPFNRMALTEKPKETRLPEAGRCIGSECMMWREITERDLHPSPELTIAFINENVIGGYCGLAGKP